MNKKLYSLPLVTVACGGIYLNTYYYIFAFISAGYGHVSYVMAIFLMLFEVVLWYFTKNSFKWILLKIALLIYSISMTLGSQFISTSIKESVSDTEIKKTEIIQDEIKDYQEQIKSLDSQINKYIDQQNKFGTMANKIDRQNAEKKMDELLTLIKISRDKMISKETILYKPKTIYKWYADILKITDPDNIRFWYQLLGSIFIALMSPVSINILSNKNKTKEIKKENLSRIDKENILKMLLWDYPEKEIKTPEEAHEEFKIVNVDRPNIPVYTIKDCKMIYNKIKKTGLIDKEEIQNEILI